ncbi:MAG: ChbG/HpnK family deacetylase [Bacteroidia bacterium]|nr:ChbG/HpnK family deacetylase [Bacteroidia bacterium]
MRQLNFFIFLLFPVLMSSHVYGQTDPAKIYLLVRADDMGFAHAVNEACIATYTEGIARSVEVIVPGPWFEEAAQMLAGHPGYDVGIHLVLTSEWQNLKWRPLTSATSLKDADGYFHPYIWKNPFPGGYFPA